ncbi:MAG: hypothetical protein Q8K29_07485 [Polaromonas sp.]|nr:hypothetical protein [Polaromonas sp.]
MRIRTLVFAALVLLASLPALALQPGDAGTYLVVNVQGQITPKAFRMVQGANQWSLEERKPDGSWASVTCETECVLRDSSEADIQRFFPAATLAQITPDCVHNLAFAFCGYSLKTNALFRGYVFVAMIANPPVSLRLARVMPDAKPGS